MNRECLRLYQISTLIGGHEILSGLSMTVNTGEVVGLLGLNRQQSLSLIEVITGKTPPSSGAFFWGDRRVAEPGAVANLPIAIVRTDSALIEDASVADNLFVYKKPRGGGLLVPNSPMYRQAGLHLQEFETGLSAAAQVGDLSVFQRRIVEILRAYLIGAQLIIIDEPPESLSPGEQAMMGRTLKHLKEKDVSVLMIDSLLTRLGSYADRLVILDNGSIQSFSQHSHEWAKLYIDQFKLPAAAKPADPASRQIAFRVSDFQISDEFDPISFCLYKGELAEVCDSGYGFNRRLISRLFPYSVYTPPQSSDGANVRLLDPQVDQYLAEDLSPFENLCIGLYPRLSRMGVISARSTAFLREEFNAWYGDPSLLQKTDQCAALTEQEKIALILYRFLMEGVQVIFCADPKPRRDYKTYAYLITMLRRLVEHKHMSVCILASEPSDNPSIYDRRIDLTPFCHR